MKIIETNNNKGYMNTGLNCFSVENFDYFEDTINRLVDGEHSVIFRKGDKKNYKMSFERTNNKVSCELAIWIGARMLYSKETANSFLRAFNQCIEYLAYVENSDKPNIVSILK